MLAGKGFKELYNLKGGIKAWEGQKISGPAETGMAFFRGDETAEDIFAIAYGMEEGLRGFYTHISRESRDQGVIELLHKLADIEEKHKEKLYARYRQHNASQKDKKAFEAKALSDVTEGGFILSEFLEQNRDLLNTVPDVLSMAMMLEAQALDLYHRYSERAEEEGIMNFLFEMAEEEKKHLKALGQLFDKKI
jgi:rubrerythrin